MLILENLNANHIESAARLALSEYYNERNVVPILPYGDYYDIFCNMIAEMTDHNLGVAAIENSNVVGFLTCYKPRNNHFGTTMGTFSPVHAHGTAKQNKRRIYSLIYQAAAEKWVKQGILSHAVVLYAHDQEAVESFFWNGFGLRTVDAIRAAEPINCGDFSQCRFYELPIEEIAQIVSLKNGLIEHLQNSPIFMPLFFTEDITHIKEENNRRKSRYFVANINDKVIGFIEIMQSGENFACDDPAMINICGAYMMPEYRSSGVYTKLLSYLMDTIANEGYTRCGVDFESFNPTASGFWLKNFTPYTYGVVRRIDERIYQPDTIFG